MIQNQPVKNIILFASGAGSNAKAIIEYFLNNEKVQINAVISNNPKAGVLAIAEKYNIETVLFNREEFYSSQKLLPFLIEKKPDLIVLAGFLWIIPKAVIDHFPNKIINIHPSLLPKYGGKGMYGDRVHRTVLKNKDKETGISIHYVNEVYDDGEIIAQFKTGLTEQDDLESLLKKIHALEHENYPKIIESILFDKHGQEE